MTRRLVTYAQAWVRTHGFDEHKQRMLVEGYPHMDDDTLITALALALLAIWWYLAPNAVQPSPGDVPFPSPDVPQPGPTPSPQPSPTPFTPNPPAPVASGADAIDLASAELVDAPDVRGWPITASLAITNLTPITPQGAPDSWPDVYPPGFTDPIQYTVWAFAFISGRWIGSAFIEMWRGRPDTGADPFGGNPAMQLANNWWYRTSGMAGYVPPSGSQVGFMLTAGDARDNKGPYPVPERSNVVLVTMP